MKRGQNPQPKPTIKFKPRVVKQPIKSDLGLALWYIKKIGDVTKAKKLVDIAAQAIELEKECSHPATNRSDVVS